MNLTERHYQYIYSAVRKAQQKDYARSGKSDSMFTEILDNIYPLAYCQETNNK